MSAIWIWCLLLSSCDKEQICSGLECWISCCAFIHLIINYDSFLWQFFVTLVYKTNYRDDPITGHSVTGNIRLPETFGYWTFACQITWIGRSFKLEVCVPELVSNEKRQDVTGRQFPNWRDRDKTTSLWSRCSEKFGKKSGKIRDGMGLLSTTREKSWMVLKWCSRMLGTGNFPDFSRKNQVPGKWHSGTQTSIKNWLYIQTKSQTINIERIDNVFSPFYFASP